MSQETHKVPGKNSQRGEKEQKTKLEILKEERKAIVDQICELRSQGYKGTHPEIALLVTKRNIAGQKIYYHNNIKKETRKKMSDSDRIAFVEQLKQRRALIGVRKKEICQNIARLKKKDELTTKEAKSLKELEEEVKEIVSERSKIYGKLTYHTKKFY